MLGFLHDNILQIQDILLLFCLGLLHCPLACCSGPKVQKCQHCADSNKYNVSSDKCSDGINHGSHATDCVANGVQEAAEQPSDGAEYAVYNVVDAVEERLNRLVDKVTRSEIAEVTAMMYYNTFELIASK